MNPAKAKQLVEFGKKQGLDESTILALRDAALKDESIALFLREQIEDVGLTYHHLSILLMAAFDLQVGDIQILHLWIDKRISDSDLDVSLEECMDISG